MANTPDTTEPDAWHRYFAVECNNRAWALAAQPARTAEEAAEMLDAAHAAALHWNAIGTELNRFRARTLLAEVHALLGFGPSALAQAEAIRTYFLARDTDDWELAFVHTIHAHAAAVAGETDLHRASYAAARAAVDAIADEADRRIVLDTFEQVPAPAES